MFILLGCKLPQVEYEVLLAQREMEGWGGCRRMRGGITVQGGCNYKGFL